MKITPEGRERIFSSGLLERIKEDHLGEQVELLLVAWVATGHDLTSPTWAECLALKRYVDDNRGEVVALQAEIRSAMTAETAKR